MSEHPHSLLPPHNLVDLLNHRFTLLSMSTEKSNDVAEVQPSVPAAIVPLALGPRQELLNHLKDFLGELPSSKNPGFFNAHFECLDEAITACPSFFFSLFRLSFFNHLTVLASPQST